MTSRIFGLFLTPHPQLFNPKAFYLVENIKKPQQFKCIGLSISNIMASKGGEDQQFCDDITVRKQ
jgi:hypothetical protein